MPWLSFNSGLLVCTVEGPTVEEAFQSISISTTTVKQENQRDERAWGEITPAVKAHFAQSEAEKREAKTMSLENRYGIFDALLSDETKVSVIK